MMLAACRPGLRSWKKTRDRLSEEGVNVLGQDCFHLLKFCIGLPLGSPLSPPSPPLSSGVTGGRSLRAGVPLPFLTGQACTALGLNSDAVDGLWAAYGPLPGPSHSVGRAERYALLRGLQLLPRLVLSVSDLLGAVPEGVEWSEEHASASAAHADIWRKIFSAAQGRATSRTPSYAW
eukprot:5886817-Pyramimonas_sp.AAC.1